MNASLLKTKQWKQAFWKDLNRCISESFRRTYFSPEKNWRAAKASVKFLMVGETNSVTDYHLMGEGH